MNKLFAHGLGRVKEVTAQFTRMSFGSGLFFLIKICWLFLTEQIGVAAWLSYLIINVGLTVVAWTYHSKVTFKTAMNARTAWRFSHATLGLMVFDYLGFVALTYAGEIYPVLSAIIISAILVGVRYLTYSAYVFRDREEAIVRWITATQFLLGIALLVGAINYGLAIDDALPKKDGRENYCAAANLYVVGILSNDCDEDMGIPSVAPRPSMKREPLTPALVASTFALLNGDQDVRACVATSPDWCTALRIHQRMLLVVPFIALILLVYFACYDITSSGALSATAALCAAFGTGLVEGSMSFLTEPAAAVLLLLVAWMLYRIVNHRHVMVSGVVCGVALGLLSLTKAVYFNFLPVLGLLALFALALGTHRRSAFSTLTAVLIAALICGLWIGRNHEHFGTNAIAGRDARVLSMRAAFTTISWSQYWTGYLAFTPAVGSRLIDFLGIGPEKFGIFDRESPESLEVGSQATKVLGGGEITRQKALLTMVENWPMELALVPLTLYRSAFLPVGFYSQHGANDPLLMRIIRLFLLAMATIIALGMLPALLLNVVVDLWRFDIARLAFHLPAVYSVGIHSVMTHYIPRYNLPLFGIFAVELCLAAAFLWSLVAVSDVRRPQAVLDEH